MSFLDFLHERNIIDRDLYEIAQRKSEFSNDYICDILASASDITEEKIAKLKSDFFALEYTNFLNFSQIENFSYDELAPSLAIPLRISNNCVYVAIDNPENLEAKNNVEYRLSICEKTRNLKLIYCIAQKSEIKRKFLEINQPKNVMNKVIFDAVSKSASDIHITPFEKIFKILLRVDGSLTEYKTFSIEEFEQLAISIKVLAKLDISETRRPQSGHFQKDSIDFRVSTHPTLYGETLVIRVLKKDKSIISIENIGFFHDQIEYLKSICSFSSGMIIFCGPTGSGKTTSIYSLIETMDKKSRNIMTLEDPIEYKISNVKQTKIIPGIIDFTDGIKSILRQDPDVILIGEIRDEETAKMALRASMTGHLVLTTIHANDSFGAIARLKEFKISNSIIADNIISIVSQRLVKKSKKSGRTIVNEILKMSPEINRLIYDDVLDKQKLKTAAINAGFKDILEDCNLKIEEGLISESDIKSIRFPIEYGEVF
ncbi:MAG: type II/IV secretion system protein [Holosporales bacterium]|jgi:type IV pilus assembly protein PilB|nr:type II/IV secretion system protein [Holosporales bacterium]